MIHPSAFIHPEAQVAGDVEIGPFAVVEGPAIIGEGCRIAAHAVLTGAVRLGKRNVIGHGAVIGAQPQDLKFDPQTCSEVIIGDDNVIRELCTIHRGTTEGSATRVGNGNFLMAGAHLGHNVLLGDRIVIANNALLGGHVEVEDGVFIGGGSVFHQFVRIGRLSIIQGLSAFSKDIPPFCLAAERNTVAGLNVVGLRRAGLDPAKRAEIRRAFDLLYRAGLNTRQALEQSKDITWGEEAAAFWGFIAGAKKRGICALLRSAEPSGGE